MSVLLVVLKVAQVCVLPGALLFTVLSQANVTNIYFFERYLIIILKMEMIRAHVDLRIVLFDKLQQP